MQQTIPTDVYIAGTLTTKGFNPPAGSITDAAVVAGAGIQATKVQQQHEPTYAQGSTAAATNDQHVIHAVRGATATVVDFSAGAITPATGNDTVTVDLYKNGASILASPITLNNSQTARALVSAGLSSTSAVAGDVFEAKITYTHNTGTAPQGVFARLTIQELPQ